MRRPLRVPQKLLKVHNDPGENFTRAELNKFLAEFKEYLEESDASDRGAAALMLRLSRHLCAEATTDSEAEFVMRGFRLGLYWAEFERKEFYRSVQAQHRRAGLKTRAKSRARLEQEITEQYGLLCPQIGDLSTRRRIRDDLLSEKRNPSRTTSENLLRYVTKVIDQAGMRQKP